MAPKLDYGMTSGVGNKSLRNFFPYLQSISFTKDAFVTYYLELSSDSHLNVSFIKAAHDWKVNVFFFYFFFYAFV
jgi:hypothetical protein